MKLLQNYYKKRVLVTGGAGFIGSHLVEGLVALGAQVTVLDNFTCGKIDNLRSVLHKINLVVGDLAYLSDCALVCQNQDYVFHLAAISSVPAANLDPQRCFKVNVQGTVNLLRALGLQRRLPLSFVLASSVSVYGTAEYACDEQEDVHPESIYAQSKLDAEKALTLWAEQNKSVSSTILRYSNVYGQRSNGQSAMARFISQLQQRQAITIFGDGLQRRDFVKVEAIVQANLVAALLQHDQCQIFNVGSGKVQTVLEFLYTLAQQLSLPLPQLNYLAPRPGDPLVSIVNCSKIQGLLTSLAGDL